MELGETLTQVLGCPGAVAQQDAEDKKERIDSRAPPPP